MLCHPIPGDTTAVAEEEGANGERVKQASKGKGKGKRKRTRKRKQRRRRRRVEDGNEAASGEEGAAAMDEESQNRVWDAR